MPAYVWGGEITDEDLQTALEANEVGGYEKVNQEIAAAATELVSVEFQKATLETLQFVSDQDLTLILQAVNQWPINDFTGEGDLVTELPGEFRVVGDLTERIKVGDTIWIEGATTPQHDGLAMVRSSAYAAGLTTFEVYKTTGVINVAVTEVFDNLEAGAVVTFVHKIEFLSVEWPATASVVAPANTFTVTGDCTDDIKTGNAILVEFADADEGIFTVLTAVYAAPNTIVTVAEALAGGLTGGTMWRISRGLELELTANEPFLWTADSLVLNPCLEDINGIQAINAGDEEANLGGRIVRSV